MAWEDRPYYRDRSGASSAGGVLAWLLNGSIPLFTAFGIRVRAHVTLLIMIVGTILFDWSKGYSIQARAFSMACLTLIVILHEFGHCFAARSVGGSADDILLWPLGGLAMASVPQRPWPNFWTAAGGPLVNVAICIVCAAGLFIVTPNHILAPLNPFAMDRGFGRGLSDPAFYFYWLYVISYILLLFNLLPIFPLDGGRLFQATLWPKLGYLKSMNIATVTGMIGGGLLIAGGILDGLNFLMIAIGLVGIMYCYQQRRILKESSPEEWAEPGIDYAASIYARDEPKHKPRRANRRAIARARRIAQQETAQRQKIDDILAKVSTQGMSSLTWRERRTLRKATERQRKSELELSRFK